MIDIDEINNEIEKLENSGTTYSNMQRLAILYIVRDRAARPSENEELGQKRVYSDELTYEISEHNIRDTLPVLEEHFIIVKSLMPREYSALLSKIKSI